MHDLIALGFVLAVVGLAFAGLRWMQRGGRVSPERARKGMHIASGLAAASFPWLFHELWTGLLVCGIACAGLMAMRIVPSLRKSIGQVTGAVERHSWGEVYFPIAVACVWTIARSEPTVYVVSVLLLTLADAAAALVGVAIGRHRYQTSEGQKSVEGSAAFFVVSSLATLGTLLALAPELEFGHAMLISVLLGALLMGFEAVSWRGLDNLLLPLLACVLLRMYLKMDDGQLAVRICLFAACVMCLVWLRARRALIGEGAIAAAMFLYGAWALGGWKWVVPPAEVVAAVPWMPARDRPESRGGHGVMTVLALATPGLAILVFRAVTGRVFWPEYIASFAAGLAVVISARLNPSPGIAVSPARCAGAAGLGWAIVLIPALLIERAGRERCMVAAGMSGLSVTTAVAIGFAPALNRLFGERLRWLLRGAAIVGGTAAAAGFHWVWTDSGVAV